MTVLQIGMVLGEQIDTTSLSMVVDGLLKLFFVLAFGLYLGFAFIATRQISIMRKTLVTSFSPILRLLGYIHFGVALLLFLWVLFL